ncbi:MAG: hypothetical protein JO345_20405 [Streptosporangiaceae bacterium]|nr:hypothetical protein [Streptosporangiaceae bacterium]
MLPGAATFHSPLMPLSLPVLRQRRVLSRGSPRPVLAFQRLRVGRPCSQRAQGRRALMAEQQFSGVQTQGRIVGAVVYRRQQAS